MELKLSLHAYPSSTKIEVETRPKQVQEWLDALPLANSQEAGRKLADAIAALNSVKLGEEARCNLLELYRTAVYKLLPSQQQLYVGKSLPLSDKNLRAAALMRELFNELANGYKKALMDLSARHVNLATHKSTALAMARAIECLSGVLEVFYETYAPVTAKVWSELYRLYWYAAKLNIHTSAISDSDGGSINTVFIKTLLLALADPYHLLQGQIAAIKAVLVQIGTHAVLQPLGPTENKHGLFLVRLDNDTPPKALMHYQGVTDARTDIILNTIPLARVLHQHVQTLDTGKAVDNLGLPMSASQPGYREMLKRLIKQWGVAPKRMFGRAQSHADAHICGGISALHHMLSADALAADATEADERITVEVSDVLQTTGSQLSYNCSKWLVVNESAGGFALTKNPESYAKLKVGDIIGVETPETGAWGVGQVRWMQSDIENRVEVGAQMLAPNAEAIAIKPVITSANALFQPALLLPEVPALKLSARIVASRGSFQPMREFEVRSQGLIQVVRAEKLIEQTDSFDLFTFN